ncbi:unnamed protein product [Allacma fusca]|uniref:Rapamycin-insensitive companion of mTOR n=1 Tax=Allacma fusca TaxID=39272 RepID=A0A8J2NW83_9HEXA|nr:unnamed protein product [Allacma fusca]
MSIWFNVKAGTSARGPAGGTSSRLNRMSRKEVAEEIVVDFNHEPRLVVGEILRNVSRKEGITKGRRLAYLNMFVKYCMHLQNTTPLGKIPDYGYSIEEICLCLRPCLIHEIAVIRMAGLRALRYMIRSRDDMLVMISTGIPYLIVRSLDVVLNNSGERMQAARFCQRMLAVAKAAENFPPAVTRALVAIGFDGLEEHDKLHRGSLSILCQLAIVNPTHFIENGGPRVLLHNVLGCNSPMVLEAILGSLLHLLNVPETRIASGINLHALVAPLTDLHFKLSGSDQTDRDADEREIGYRAARIAITTVLRSWSGLCHFCQDLEAGLQELVDALFIEQLEIRRTILDLLCEIIGLKFPTWTDEISVALHAVDPSYPLYHDNWKLQEGFVVQEAFNVLPHLAANTPNITANHKALLVYALVRRGLLDALVEVIVSSDTFISVRATVLLGELLSLVDQYIPVECFDPSQCIPSLIRHSMTDTPPFPKHASYFRDSPFSSSASVQLKQHRALEAISILSAIRKIKCKPATPNSVFLQMQLDFANFSSKCPSKFVDRLGQMQLSRVLKKDIENNPGKILKETGVTTSKDQFSWNWELIFTLIRWVPNSLKKVDDSSWRTFLRRLIDFFKPSNNIFARIELGKGQSHLYARVGCYLMEFLADEAENFSGTTLLEEFLADVALHLDELLRNNQNPYVCFLSPSRLESTVSQTYFLFLGKLTQSPKGMKMLERQEIMKRLLDLVREMHNDYYVKLIVSSLYYGEEYCRRILTAAMMSNVESARMYATQFLRVLMRAKLPDFSKWGIEILVNQLVDRNKAISLTSLDILEEAIHDKMFLESLIGLRPTLTTHGDRGLLLLICFLSLPSGYKYLMEANFLRSEIEKWKRSFNKRYVELVEVLVRDSVSTLRRGEDGKYPERASRNQEQSLFVDIYVPPHMYGQLAQHKPGLELLLEIGNIDGLMEVVLVKKCDTPEETRELKAALWALAHLATSVDALQIVEDGGILEAMVSLAAECPILSVRHTAFHCLCLISCTQPGAESLSPYGWHAMPRSHHEPYPIWGYLAASCEKKPKTVFPDLDMDLETMEILDKASLNSRTDSNILIEEDADSIRYFMFEEGDTKFIDEVNNGGILSEDFQEDSSQAAPPVLASTRKISYEHHRSQSDSQAISKMSPLEPTNNNRNSIISNHSKDEVDQRLSTSGGSSKGIFGGGSLRGKVSSIWSGTTAGTSLGSNRFGTLGSTGSFRWGKRSRSESVAESSTSGISSSDSNSINRNTSATTDHVQTLSPIPSSASIATTILSNPPSLSNLSPSSRDHSRALTDPGTRFGSPIYRSVIRKPVIRAPILSDPDIYPQHHHRRLGSVREIKAGSLDRHFMLSPRDLFNESKLMRVNSSMTSLSTPSFRTRPEVETRGPCFMGLCLPKEFNMIFLSGTKKNPRKFSSEASSEESLGSDGNINREQNDATFTYHSPDTCLGCIKLKEPKTVFFGDETLKSMENLTVTDGQLEGNRNSMVSVGSVMSCSSVESTDRKRIIPESPHGKNLLRKEIIRLVSNMISCVGAKSNEQGLLRLKQKFPRAFHDLCLYSELCGLMSSYNVRLPLRRFVQELFLDLPFDEFYIIADKILYPEIETSNTSASTTTTDTSESSTVIEVPIGPLGGTNSAIPEVDDTTPCPSPSDDPDSDYIDLK